MSHNRRVLSSLALMSSCMLLLAGPSSAVIRSGKLKIVPSVGLSTTYDSNIYLTAEGEKGSLVTTLTPKVALSLPVDQHEFRFMYGAEIIGYTENPSLNNAFHNNLLLSANFRFPVGLMLTAFDEFNSTTDPATSELTERVKRTRNNLGARVGYRFTPALAASLGHTQVTHDYADRAFATILNRKESATSLEVDYAYSEKTSALVDLESGTVDYTDEDGRDSTYLQARVGVRGHLTPKTTGEVRLGVKTRNYDSAAIDDVTTSVAGLATRTEFSPRTGLRLGAVRNLVESTYQNNAYFVGTAFTIDLDQKIYRNWTASLNGAFEANDYPNANDAGVKRRDSVTGTGFTVAYSAYEWLSFGGSYAVRLRNSNINRFDYTDHLVTLKTKVLF